MYTFQYKESFLLLGSNGYFRKKTSTSPSVQELFSSVSTLNEQEKVEITKDNETFELKNKVILYLSEDDLIVLRCSWIKRGFV